MNRFIRIIGILFICLLGYIEVKAQKKILGFSRLDDTVAVDKNGLFFLPLLYYTPDTRWALGGAGVYYFRVQPKYEHELITRVSYVQFLADYTQNKQIDVWGLWNIFSRNENFLFKGELRYRDFPDRFYGIGNNTLTSAEEKYTYQQVSIKSLALKRIKPSLFVGIDYHFESEYGFEYSEEGSLSQGTITGYNGGIGSAMGLVGIYDNRDNAINTLHGKLIELSTYLYTPILGSTFSFSSINGTYQHFWPIKKSVLALQAKMRLSYGEVPFLDLSMAGGDDMLRGYPKNRFRDQHFIGTQLEYRYPLFWRLGLVSFVGIGDVFHQVSDIRANTLKYSIGSGLRFVVNPAERLNIRFDYAIGREGGYFYFSVGESF